MIEIYIWLDLLIFFDKWFEDVYAWEKSDLAKSNHAWMCLSRVLPCLWEDDFFQSMDSMFEEVIEVTRMRKQRRDFSKSGLKIDLRKPLVNYSTVIMESKWDDFVMETKVFGL